MLGPKIRRVYNVLEGMTPPVGGGRCAVLALGHWGSDRRSAARARRQRVAQAILRYRCRRRGRCRPPRRLAASGVPVQMRRAPIIKSAKSGPAPSIELCARSDAADRPVRRAQGSRMGPARSQPPRARPPHSCTLPSMALPSSPPTATWPSRRRRRGEAPHSCLALHNLHCTPL